MPLQRLSIAVDVRFWPAAGRATLDFAARHGLRANRLQDLIWVVPSGAHAALARDGLRDALAPQAFIPPRIAPLAAWIEQPPQEAVAARAELFAALRASRWVRESFGTQPAALWALARSVAQLCEALTWAAIEGEDAFADRLQSALTRHFFRRAARALQPQAQLVLQLWRARRDDTGAARALRALAARAAGASQPLVYLASEALQGWEDAFLRRYAARAPVLLIEADIAAALAARPVLAAAWPELSDAPTQAPIAARAQSVRGQPLPLRLAGARSLEEEAGAIAQQVLDWRRAGVESIALIALDRLTARRARALLERAQVGVRDETGWKLSTTSAAAAVMRWFDLVADDSYWRDLLDWLKSPFTLADRGGKAREVALIERAIRAEGVIQGTRAVRRALSDIDGESADGAREVLALIDAQVQRARRAGSTPAAHARAGSTLAAHARALGEALTALGLRGGLAADAVGREVLREIDALEGELAHVAGAASLADFRALLADRFEEVSFVDRQAESPVVMLSLAAAHLRPFDAALLIGADARHLPVARDELLFMSNAVRAELGLATAEAELRSQSRQLAALLAIVPRVVATWRVRHGDEPNPVSPLLARLRFVAARTPDDECAGATVPGEFEVYGVTQNRPAPRAPQLLSAAMSASQAQSLVNCAYQFHARHLLKLAELEDVVEHPDKRDFGDALHRVLHRFHAEWGAADFGAADAAELARSLAAHAHAVFDPLLERTPALLAFRRRFDRLIEGYVAWLRQHAADGWRWQAGEQEARRALRLADGSEIALVGRIDRIDAHHDGRVHVIDYKARAADVLRRNLRDAGEDVQLPFYGLLLALPATAAYVSFDRAKEDDGGVTSVVPPQPFDTLVEDVAGRLRADVQRLAGGAPLPAIGVDAVCGHCEMRGLCRRDYWEREGDDG